MTGGLAIPSARDCQGGPVVITRRPSIWGFQAEVNPWNPLMESVPGVVLWGLTPID